MTIKLLAALFAVVEQAGFERASAVLGLYAVAVFPAQFKLLESRGARQSLFPHRAACHLTPSRPRLAQTILQQR